MATRPSARRRAMPLLAGWALATACTGEPAPPWVGDLLDATTPATPRMTPLAYQTPPADCPWAYEIEVDYDTPPLGEDPSISGALVVRPVRGGYVARPSTTIPRGTTLDGHLFYQGVRVSKRGARREIHFGRTAVGPAAPTAPCTARTWDPLEDFLALAFPELPDHPVTTGRTWNGARVEGRCNKTACIDPETYAGGRENHLRPCVTEDVQETLVGIVDTPGGPVAAIEGTWSDGHGDAGISMERKALVSVASGRPLYAKTTIHHRFPQPTYDHRFGPITRTVTIRAIDACPGTFPHALFEDAGDRRTTLLEGYEAFERRK